MKRSERSWKRFMSSLSWPLVVHSDSKLKRKKSRGEFQDLFIFWFFTSFSTSLTASKKLVDQDTRSNIELARFASPPSSFPGRYSSSKMIPTPSTSHLKARDFESVYEPAGKQTQLIILYYRSR